MLEVFENFPFLFLLYKLLSIITPFTSSSGFVDKWTAELYLTTTTDRSNKQNKTNKHIYSAVLCNTFLKFNQSYCAFLRYAFLFGLRLYVPVNNFTVMSGGSHGFLGITRTFWEVNVNCSRIQHGDLSED